MNIRRILRGATLFGLVLLCLSAGGCSSSQKPPATYACRYAAGLSEAGLLCVPHQVSSQLSVYKAVRKGDIVGLVVLPPALFSNGVYGAREAENRLHVLREAGQMFFNVGCYGGPTSTVVVDNTQWQVTDCGLGTYVQGDIFEKGHFGVYLRQGADVRKSMERVIGSVRSSGRPLIVM